MATLKSLAALNEIAAQCADNAGIGHYPAEHLLLALEADDLAEEHYGMHPDDRVTCWTCKSWADHAHDIFTGKVVAL